MAHYKMVEALAPHSWRDIIARVEYLEDERQRLVDAEVSGEGLADVEEGLAEAELAIKEWDEGDPAEEPKKLTGLLDEDWKFHSFDSGNCRAYYKGRSSSGRSHLYCIQDETSWGRPSFRFYVCSQDGEPSHDVPCPFEDMAAEYDRRALAAGNKD